ncbi:MAG: phosphotransferase [Halobacteriovoraceae bacterium]|nr:phosphotransferase [Halobacteriovoraceae bacterium]
MASYTKLDRQDIDAILELYQLPGALRITPQGHGISNSNYEIQLENSQKILLKVSNDKDLEALQEEQNILMHLHQNGYLLSLNPLLTSDKQPVYQHKGHIGVIYPYVEGHVPHITEESCQEIARSLAKLHHVPGSSQIRSCTKVGFDLKKIFEYTQTKQCPEFFRTSFHKVFSDQEIKDYLNEKFAMGIIHGDLYYDNTMFNNDKIVKIIDFEQSGIGEYILDIGISISGTCLDNGVLKQNLIDAYLQAYNEIRPLPDSERKFMNMAISIGLFSISLWRIKRFYEGNLDKSRSDSYQELIARALQFKGITH